MGVSYKGKDIHEGKENILTVRDWFIDWSIDWWIDWLVDWRCDVMLVAIFIIFHFTEIDQEWEWNWKSLVNQHSFFFLWIEEYMHIKRNREFDEIILAPDLIINPFNIHFDA